MPDQPKPNCLAGCGEKYKADPVHERAPSIDVPITWNSAPLIEATIANGSNKITVGNDSYPSNPNKAIIKSIEFGFIDTNQGKLEIVDEEGSELSVFLDSVQKCAKRFESRTEIKFRVGWTTTTCGSTSGSPAWSPYITALILSIQSNLSNGLIKFIVNFASSEAVVQNWRQDETFGEEIAGKDMKLEEAIQALCAKDPAINVRFGWYDESGELKFGNHKWVNHGEKGPKAAWHGDSLNKYATIMHWIEPYRIDHGKNGKGAILIHDPKEPNDLIILRDPTPDCDEKVNPTLHLGTFLVNAGKCSNVLEFNPTFDFISAMAAFASGGTTKGGLKSNNVFKEKGGKSDCEKPHGDNAGPENTTSPTQQIVHTDGPDSASDEANKSQQRHLVAGRLVDVKGAAITAELRVVGMVYPKLYQMITGYRCSIVVISPFYIQGGQRTSSGYQCGDFLKKASCHPFYSNKEWLVNGINHSVQEGSFVTTLKLTLPSPGVELDSGNTLGASSTGKGDIGGTCG